MSRLYVGRLGREVREKDVERLFRTYGDIREINLKNGFGFVEFKDSRDASDALKGLNDTSFYGERYGPPQRTNYRLIIENLASGVSWQYTSTFAKDLKDYMRRAGEVTFADAHKDRDGEGVVEYSSYEDMKNAIRKLDDTELKGKRIYLRERWPSSLQISLAFPSPGIQPPGFPQEISCTSLPLPEPQG
ncbi:serine arginine-rich splicing factor [Quaeritorhiza haematococci]|nr:serine arginine-rich splicing factor [Quaeritorhiza haematococci]